LKVSKIQSYENFKILKDINSKFLIISKIQSFEKFDILNNAKIQNFGKIQKF